MTYSFYRTLAAAATRAVVVQLASLLFIMFIVINYLERSWTTKALGKTQTSELSLFYPYQIKMVLNCMYLQLVNLNVKHNQNPQAN